MADLFKQVAVAFFRGKSSKIWHGNSWSNNLIFRGLCGKNPAMSLGVLPIVSTPGSLAFGMAAPKLVSVLGIPCNSLKSTHVGRFRETDRRNKIRKAFISHRISQSK